MGKLENSNRLFFVPFIAILILGIIFMIAVLPMVKMNPKNVPIGLVVADEGAMGKALADALVTGAPELVKFKSFDSMKALQDAMDDREVYGALVLPEDFSSKVATHQTNTPEKATALIYINEGANATVSTVVQSALTNMVSGLNTQLSSQMLTAAQAKTDKMKQQLDTVLKVQGEDSQFAQLNEMISPIQPSKVQDFANPIQSEVFKVNETGSLGNAPIAFMTITWFSSLIGAVMLYLAGNKHTFASRLEKMKFNALQSFMPFVYGLAAGYAATWYSTWLLDFEFAHFNRTALFISICVTAFTFMIFATLRWLKLPSIAIYVLLMFFSMAAVQLAPEMMPSFYRDYIISWLPLRFFVEGLREVLFFSHEVINRYSVVLLGVLAITLLLVWIKNVVEKTETKQS